MTGAPSSLHLPDDTHRCAMPPTNIGGRKRKTPSQSINQRRGQQLVTLSLWARYVSDVLYTLWWKTSSSLSSPLFWSSSTVHRSFVHFQPQDFSKKINFKQSHTRGEQLLFVELCRHHYDTIVPRCGPGCATIWKGWGATSLRDHIIIWVNTWTMPF